MTINPYRLIALLVASFVLVVGLALAGAAQPACTGDRHYDEAGQCCPYVEGCPDVAGCPDVLPCPPVECTCLTENKTTVVQVAPVVCPAAPRYIRCKYLLDGTIKCPIKDHPRRVFVPEPAAK